MGAITHPGQVLEQLHWISGMGVVASLSFKVPWWFCYAAKFESHLRGPGELPLRLAKN